MPKWKDKGIILKSDKHGEKGTILTVFTEEHGRYLGWQYMSSKKKVFFQPGDIVSLTWNARLSEQLGVFNFDTGKSTIGKIIGDFFRLSVLASFCSLINIMLPERENCHNFFQICKNFLNILTDENVSNIKMPKKYLEWEISLLAEVGISLNFTQCVLTGSRDNLKYVSPKSGCAVSEEYRGEYKRQLIDLPNCLGGKKLLNDSEYYDLIGGFNLTNYFFKKFFHSIDYNYINNPLVARTELIKNLELKFFK